MSASSSHHVTVRLTHGFEFLAEFNDVNGAPPLLLDEPPPLGGGHGPNAAALLGAAVGNCLAASLAFCLRRTRTELVDLTANVTTHVTRNEKGHFRISGIDVELVPELGPINSADPKSAALERCDDLFEDFCTVTASVRRGIPVTISVKEPAHSTV